MRLKNIRNSYPGIQFAFKILFPLLILSGCASTEDLGRIQWDVNELKSEIKDVKVKSPTPVERQNLDKKLLEIQSAQETTAKSVSDLLIQVQSLTNEFRILTGRFEEARYHSDRSSAEMKEEKEKVAGKIRELELSIDELKKRVSHPEKPESAAKQEELKQPDEGRTAEGKKTAEEGKDPGKKEPEKTEGKKEAQKPDVKDVYMAAYQAYKDNRTVEAREKFSSLLKDYPDNEYTDNARFWIAESYYKDGNYEDAILAYEDVLKKNPKSDKVPSALLKQGMAFYELKDEKTGKIILEKLIQTYPDSEQAKTAKKKIEKPAPPKKK
jgi:tol-pal system protein YbgF